MMKKLGIGMNADVNSLSGVYVLLSVDSKSLSVLSVLSAESGLKSPSSINIMAGTSVSAPQLKGGKVKRPNSAGTSSPLLSPDGKKVHILYMYTHTRLYIFCNAVCRHVLYIMLYIESW